MNKNLFIYSFKYLAVLLALVTFSSCERDEFTEDDAFALEQARLEAQNTRNQTNLNDDVDRLERTLEIRQRIEALTRANAGGRVLYSVVVVPGSDAAFSSGRFEEIEGLDGAVVTVSQFNSGNVTGQDGITQEVTTNAAGVASFELYSGEVTVSITSPNHTTVNYTANLTPDGGVANGANVAVSNVIPVFEDPNNPVDAANFATIKGFAFAETDLATNADGTRNNYEEPAPDGVKVRAFIDVNTAFMAKYVNPMNGTDEGTNINGNTTKSGLVRRIAYEDAVSTTDETTLTDLTDDSGVGVTSGATQGGFYEISMAGTASGLPIMMKFDDFAANRRYVFGDEISNNTGGADGDFGVGTKRFLYTQNTELVNGMAMANPTPFLTGATDLAANFTTINFDFATTDATATATIAGGDKVDNISVSNGGYYYLAPDVEISGNATGTAVLGDLPAATPGEPATLTAARARGLKRVVSVSFTAGSGYTSAPSVTFTRKSYTGTNADGPIPNGTGSVQAPSSEITYIQIGNGGFGMSPGVAAGTAVTGEGVYTGTAPGVVFDNNIPPAGGTLATATAVVDETVGTVTEVQITNGGDGYDNDVNVTFNYGSDAAVTATGTTPALFREDGTGALEWNTAGGGRTLNFVNPVGSTTIGANTDLEVQYAPGSNYTFVPSVTVTAIAPAVVGASQPTLAATVVDGQVTALEISGGNGYTAGEYTGTINISANPDGVLVTADAFTEGGSIDSYILTNYGTVSYKETVDNTAGASFDYLTTSDGMMNTIGDIEDKDGNAVTTTTAQRAASDFIVVFDDPATGSSNAWGFPIFDNEGNTLVGVLIKNKGVGYTGARTTVPFWVVPADLADSDRGVLANYKGTGAANATASASLNATNLTITFDTPGSGYAVRPEFRLSGGNLSAEDLAGINTAINGAIRNSLNFNEAGEITNGSLSYTGTLPAFGDLATNPINVAISVARLENEFNAEVNAPMLMANGMVTGTGVLARSSNGTSYTGLEYYLGGNETTALAVFDDIALRTPVSGTYITAPAFTANFGNNNGGAGVLTGTAGNATLNPAARIDGLAPTSLGTVPAGAEVNGVAVSSFFYQLNDVSYDANGERFETIGGSSMFDVYSGMTYIRDVNYGTGIELE
ncbi:hypothetical protein WAF17_13500 [Bernardetia sp. ABR2-2B]|uniref:beta strand repeat-containing protein n=1 Tax=Bernardetia sp. ABR2-2B TaxID=3127472 RepID=UPI0030CAE731